jgi:hypothetical protein
MIYISCYPALRYAEAKSEAPASQHSIKCKPEEPAFSSGVARRLVLCFRRLRYAPPTVNKVSSLRDLADAALFP